MEYIETPGAQAITRSMTLGAALEKVMDKVADELNDRIEAMEDALKDVDSWSDSDITAYVALKADVEALVAEGKAFNDQIEEIAETFRGVDAEADIGYLDARLGAGATDSGFWDREVEAVKIKLVAAAQSDATVAEMQDVYKRQSLHNCKRR